ncbi:MAG: DNA replication and repair protein RecF [Lentisphaerae bacterium]|nr:DNA replication and repair protein RecF [Lentisphaerota bacterium]
MVIEKLELADFRNFTCRELAFSHQQVIFHGPNGTGKSNALESIAFLSLLRSFRNAPTRELIRLGAKSFTLGATIRTAHGREKIRVRESLSGQRELFIGKAAIRRSSEFIREFHCVVFSPEDRMITGGSSGCRRKFFDILISTVEPEYLQRLSRYTRALLQRNRALKQNLKLVNAFDEELAEQAPCIARRRRFYAEKLADNVNTLLDSRGSIELNYKTDTPDSPEEFLKLLHSRKASELRRSCTLTGIQLDEFEIIFDGKPLRNFGSTGQLRLISLLMKLAQFKLFRQETPAPVAVLADDITGELDEKNLQLFLETISGADQSFFTFASTIPDALKESEIIRF